MIITKEYEHIMIQKRGTLKNPNTNVYLVDIGFGKKLYTTKEIIDLTNIELSEKQLQNRFRKLNMNVGSFYTIKDAIYSPAYQKQRKNKEIHWTKRKEIKQIAEMDSFNKSMKLFKPGSLHKEARVMQSYPIGEEENAED